MSKKKVIMHFPFPPLRADVSIDRIIKPNGRELTEEEEQFHHYRIFNKDVQLLKAQYMLIENDLLTTFDYVYPNISHINVFSPKYAFIIKNACNLFEMICRKIYFDIFNIDSKDCINAYNFFSLDLFLDFNDTDIVCERLETEFPKTKCNVLKPFCELQWDKISTIKDSMLPRWWIAYNKVKHDFTSYTKYANLENSLRSVYALAILIYKVYGAGVSVGKPLWYEMVDNEKLYFPIDTALSRLFSNNEGIEGYRLS